MQGHGRGSADHRRGEGATRRVCQHRGERLGLGRDSAWAAPSFSARWGEGRGREHKVVGQAGEHSEGHGPAMGWGEARPREGAGHLAPGCGERHQDLGVGLGVVALHGLGRGEKGKAASRPRPRRQSRSDDIAWRARGASAGRPMVTRTRVGETSGIGVRCAVEVGLWIREFRPWLVAGYMQRRSLKAWRQFLLRLE